MASSKTFVLCNGVTVEKIGEHLVTWFQNTKNMVSEGGRAQGGGYFVQAKDQEDGWKKISGLTKAIQVQLMKADNNVIVNCDFGKWSDKIGGRSSGNGFCLHHLLQQLLLARSNNRSCRMKYLLKLSGTLCTVAILWCFPRVGG